MKVFDLSPVLSCNFMVDGKWYACHTALMTEPRQMKLDNRSTLDFWRSLGYEFKQKGGFLVVINPKQPNLLPRDLFEDL